MASDPPSTRQLKTDGGKSSKAQGVRASQESGVGMRGKKILKDESSTGDPNSMEATRKLPNKHPDVLEVSDSDLGESENDDQSDQLKEGSFTRMGSV